MRNSFYLPLLVHQQKPLLRSLHNVEAAAGVWKAINPQSNWDPPVSVAHFKGSSQQVSTTSADFPRSYAWLESMEATSQVIPHLGHAFLGTRVTVALFGSAVAGSTPNFQGIEIWVLHRRGLAFWKTPSGVLHIWKDKQASALPPLYPLMCWWWESRCC